MRKLSMRRLKFWEAPGVPSHEEPRAYTPEELAADALRQLEVGLERPASEPPDLTLLLDVEAERQLNILRQPAPSKRESAYFRPFGS